MASMNYSKSNRKNELFFIMEVSNGYVSLS